MKIYFACSITGGRRDELVYQQIVTTLLADGHEVPSAVFAMPAGDGDEKQRPAAEVYRRDTGWIAACDALIAEVSTPSHGVGYEIGYALNLEKPVLCLHQAQRPVSKMITGNPVSLLDVRGYETPAGAVALARAFLDRPDTFSPTKVRK